MNGKAIIAADVVVHNTARMILSLVRAASASLSLVPRGKF